MQKTISLKNFAEKNLLYNFLFFFFLVFLSCNGMAMIFVKLYPNLEIALLSDVKEKLNWIDLTIAVVIAPLLETAILVYCLSISKQIFENRRITLIVSAAPISLLHGIPNWQLILIVFLPFYFQSMAYVALRPYYKRKICMLFLVILHALTNFVAIYANR
jgi:hypothetical protein